MAQIDWSGPCLAPNTWRETLRAHLREISWEQVLMDVELFLPPQQESAASSQIHLQTIHDLFAGHHVSDAMRRDYTAIVPDITLKQLINEYILRSSKRSLVVKQDDQVVGLLTLHNIKTIQSSDWSTTTAT